MRTRAPVFVRVYVSEKWAHIISHSRGSNRAIFRDAIKLIAKFWFAFGDCVFCNGTTAYSFQPVTDGVKLSIVSCCCYCYHFVNTLHCPAPYQSADKTDRQVLRVRVSARAHTYIQIYLRKVNKCNGRGTHAAH